jgi:glycosyltransferase involved in cell wall biosynthesis
MINFARRSQGSVLRGKGGEAAAQLAYGGSVTRYKLANVVLEDSEMYANCPALYCRFSGRPAVYQPGAGAFALTAGCSYDFSTYFNACSNTKWQKYASVTNVHLHLELAGACTVELTCAGNCDQTARSLGIEATLAGDKPGVQTVELSYPASSEVLYSFVIKAGEGCAFYSGYYYTEIEQERIQPVKLKLATTTFKKEQFIEHNMELLDREITQGEEPMASDFEMIVVDNGRTLDYQAFNERYRRITVFPNKNVGGSGGFARGMIEALRAKEPATHVLVMDDDVVISAESIKRVYYLLGIVNDEYREAFISGGMLGLDLRDTQSEDVARLWESGIFLPGKFQIRLPLLRDLVYNEQFDDRTQWDQGSDPMVYAAWWFCCIPAATIKREGLPMPFFIRADDIEYSLRANPRFMTMNGIGIWHMPFYLRYSGVQDRYFLARNDLIVKTIHSRARRVDFFNEFYQWFQCDLKKLNYSNAEMMMDGIEAMLAGPSCVLNPPPDNVLGVMGKRLEQLEPLDSLREKTGPIDFDMPHLLAEKEGHRGWPERIMDYLTWNGNRAPESMLVDEPAVIPYEAWSYLPRKSRMHKTLIVVDHYNNKGVVRTMDKARFKAVLKRWKRAKKDYERREEELRREYAAAFEQMRTLEFWKQYLEID